MTAKKFDGQKVDLSLMPLAALVQTCIAFQLGKAKYGRYNYMLGMDASRLFAAALRHLYSWFYGLKETDEESGGHHLGHAIACISMLIVQQVLGTLRDDRPHSAPTTTSLQVPQEYEERYTEEYWMGVRKNG